MSVGGTLGIEQEVSVDVTAGPELAGFSVGYGGSASLTFTSGQSTTYKVSVGDLTPATFTHPSSPAPGLRVREPLRYVRFGGLLQSGTMPWSWSRNLLPQCLMASLVACGSGGGDDGAGTARQLSGTVAGWSGAGSEVVAELFDGESLQTIAEGTIEATGAVRVTLPRVVGAELLTPLRGTLPCDEVDVVSEGALVAVLFSLTVLRDGQPYAAIAQASSAAATFPLPSEKGAYRVYRWYVDRDVNVEGTCETNWGGHRFAHRWSLELEAGWHVVVETITELTASSEVRETTVSGAHGDEASWYFLDFVMLPETD